MSNMLAANVHHKHVVPVYFGFVSVQSEEVETGQPSSNRLMTKLNATGDDQDQPTVPAVPLVQQLSD